MINKIIKAFIIWGIIVLVVFSGFSFAWWNINPGQWTALDRGLLAFFCVISGIITLIITFKNEIES